jgi:Ca2+:H+ antiporter
MTELFVGIFIIAILTNIAEITTAVRFSLDNRLDLALQIALSSAIQIALFVVPLLVIISNTFGLGFSLVFSGFEMVTLLLAVMLVNHLAADGTCNWLEGVQLISVYLIIAVAFYFMA